MKRKLISFIISILFVASVNAQSNNWFDNVNYKGAFGSTNWAKGWTALDHYDYFAKDKISSNTVVVKDEDINSGDVVYWTADNTYLLDGFVFVEEGAVLNIEAGTVIKGKEGQGESASALIITKGAKIYAEGRADAPIIFTAESDDVTNPLDLELPASNLWGGLILLGKATINTATGVGNIEGIPEEARTEYGGSDDDDNSGVLRYVSIRHGGTDIGAGKEINGLTLGAVGRKTTIDYIEVFNNNDDGYEWFGGTVNVKHLVSAFNADDSFDFDEGYRGKLQFLFAIQLPDLGNRSGEHDGGTDPEDGMPYAFPQIYNATYLGSGINSTNAENDHTFKIRDYWGGLYKNSIFGDTPGDAMDIEKLESGNDSYSRLQKGEIVFSNNIFFNYGVGNDWASLGKHEWESNLLADANNNNLLEDPKLNSVSRDPYTNNLDPRPVSNGIAYESNLAEIPNDQFFDQVNYKGAFGSTNWLKGWTALDHYGYLKESKKATNKIIVKDSDINAGDKIFWTADNEYILDGFVFVEDGAVLNIEAGTVIKGKEGQGENASALIITKGAKIYAEGTGVEPIIFTAEADDVTNPLDLELPASNLWGGLILLGKAKVNTASGTGNIEGIPEEARTEYGGDDDSDNSGILRYVSVRHGGTDIGAGKEINGVTFGAVGNGTTIDYVEVFNNNDDGYEWFGGSVNCKHLVSAFNADDSFDHDEGLRGKMQFLFAIQLPELGNRSGEHDGGTDPEDGAPYAFPQSFNVTYLGSGMESTNAENDHTFKIRDFWGGLYKNSIFGDTPGDAMDVEKLDSGNDCYKRLINGEIVFTNNIFFNYGVGNDWASLGKHEWESDYLGDATNKNEIVSPSLISISRAPFTNALDPRPEANGAAYQNLADFVTDIAISKIDNELPAEYELNQNYPNPFNPTTTISFKVPQSSNVELNIYNILGQRVAQLINSNLKTGSYQVVWNAKNLASGIYVYALKTNNQMLTKKMTLLK